jgi:hypothetical protein
MYTIQYNTLLLEGRQEKDKQQAVAEIAAEKQKEKKNE